MPAPPGFAEAWAAKVGGLLALSHTRASASGAGESSTANALELLGVAPAPLGGTQNGPGSSSGALLDTGNKIPSLRLGILPWTVTNTSTASGNTASGLADVLLVDLGTPGTAQSVTLRVLQSTSDASWTPAQSSARGTSDGAILDVGGPSGLLVDVLHSQTSSSGAGSSYLVSINGNEIGTSGQTNGSCVLNLPGILSLSCLTASGGSGILGAGGTTGQTSGAGVLSTTLGGTTTGLTTALLQSTSSSGHAPSGSGTGTGTGTGTGQQTGGNGTGGTVANTRTKVPAASAAKPIASSTLAFTGAEIADALAVGGTAIASGVILIGASRRRRRPTA